MAARNDGGRLLDVLVIGAGISGIGFAQTYLSIHPEASVLLVDRESRPGGQWNSRRLYPGLWSSMGSGMTEFSDQRMKLAPGEEVKHSYMTGNAVNRYLEDYLDRRSPNGTTLRSRLRLGIEVTAVERTDDGWSVIARSLDGSVHQYLTRKLVVASGVAPEPHMPELPNRESFKGVVAHSSDFGASGVLSNDQVRHVVVYGGAKSAADMAYTCARAGKEVTWLIRESGAGPATLIPASGRGNHRNFAEYSSTRIMGSMSPSPWAPDNTRTRFMGRTVLGRSIMVSPWSSADKAIAAVFDNAKEMKWRDNFQKLRPTGSVFWANSKFGLAQHPDFWEIIADRVNVRRADISSLTPNGIILDSQIAIPCDALLCGTGREANYSMFTAEEQHRLGLPVEIQRQTASESALWSFLHEDADSKLFKKWPAIMNPPRYEHKKATRTSHRLYKYMAPLQDPSHSVVFIGHTMNANAFRNAEAQSLWATAYLDHRLRMPSLEQQRREVAEVNVWCRRRYLLDGMAGNCMHFDLIGYTDALLDELGLDSHRLGFSRWQWWSRANFASDLRGLKKEYLEKYEGVRSKSEDRPAVPHRRSNASLSDKPVGPFATMAFRRKSISSSVRSARTADL